MRPEEYRAVLKTRPLHNLRAAAENAKRQLALTDALEQHEDIFDGPFPPSKAYENWKAHQTAQDRHTLNVCLSLIQEEISARAASVAQNRNEEDELLRRADEICARCAVHVAP